MKLKTADPAAIKKYVAEITRIGNKVNDPELYNRIEKACLNQQAFLFVSHDGFLVLKTLSGRRVLIWVAYSNKPTDRLAYFFEIERLARDVSATMITFWSNRTGFHKVAPAFGFSSTQAEWMGKPICVWAKKLTY